MVFMMSEYLLPSAPARFFPRLILREFPLVFVRKFARDHKDAIMNPRVSPFYGGASAELVIDDHTNTLQKVVDGLNSVICIATFDGFRKTYIQFVSAENPAASDLRRQSPRCVMVPFFVFDAGCDATATVEPPKGVR